MAAKKSSRSAPRKSGYSESALKVRTELLMPEVDTAAPGKLRAAFREAARVWMQNAAFLGTYESKVYLYGAALLGWSRLDFRNPDHFSRVCVLVEGPVLCAESLLGQAAVHDGEGLERAKALHKSVCVAVELLKALAYDYAAQM